MKAMNPGLLFLACCSLYAQQFEAASVKPSPPPGSELRVTAVTGGPGTNDPGLFRVTNLDFKGLVTLAYATTSFQIAAPDWMNSQMFDVSARVPTGATREEFRVMLQNLLTDRFRLAVHRETRTQARYDLVVATNGPVLKKAAEDPAAAPSRPPLPKGRVGRYRPRETMESFAAYLTNYMGKFVNDTTGLKGQFEISLSWVQSDLAGTPDSNAGEPTLEHALQDQLGLQLRGSRGPVEFLVVDHAERVPAGN